MEQKYGKSVQKRCIGNKKMHYWLYFIDITFFFKMIKIDRTQKGESSNKAT